MAEAIKQLNVRSLVIVNRIELVEQTADGFEEYLGVKIGRMYEGTLDIKSQITVASVQTISAILKRNDKKLITYLFNVNCLMFDECQNVSDKGFYTQILKYLVNADYIIGLSGSAWRNYEPETLSMKALVGDIIYSKTTRELELEGFICPTKTIFIRTPTTSATEHLSYHDAYDYYITNNEARNKLVQDITLKYKENKKILILTKLIEHGEILQKMIPQSLLINSHTAKSERSGHFEKFKKERGFVLIGSQQIFSTGINIPDLDMIINVSASKSSIMCIQSIGRVKRKFPGKEFGYYIDFFDNDVEVFSHGSRKRMRLLEEHGNEYNIVYSLDGLDKFINVSE
jgi:superfamily II DNA or RNA helicase